jgi:hypothetical protein
MAMRTPPKADIDGRGDGVNTAPWYHSEPDHCVTERQ